MARPRKARAEGTVEAIGLPPEAEHKIPDPAPGNNGVALSRLVEFFKKKHHDTWETLALCPLQHGLDVMIEALGQD